MAEIAYNKAVYEKENEEEYHDDKDVNLMYGVYIIGQEIVWFIVGFILGVIVG